MSTYVSKVRVGRSGIYLLLGTIASLGWTFGMALLLTALLPGAVVPRGWLVQDLLEEERWRVISIGLLLLFVGTSSFLVGDYLSGVWFGSWSML